MTELDMPTLVDLRRLRRDERPIAWAKALPTLFPGLQLARWLCAPSVGQVQLMRLATSRAWSVSTSAIEVSYEPPETPRPTRLISLMLQLEGSIGAEQLGRQCQLTPGDLCLLDNTRPFRLVAAERSRFLALQIPLQQVTCYYPALPSAYATRFDASAAATIHLRQHLLQTLRAANYLCEQQQEIALDSFIRLLGLLDLPLLDPSNLASQALAMIEAELGDTRLSAAALAGRLQISRRQLDRQCQATYGHTTTGLIRERRLARCAQWLRDPARSRCTLTDIALACGFADSAHFTRAFKQRYQLTPSQWRQANGKGGR